MTRPIGPGLSLIQQLGRQLNKPGQILSAAAAVIVLLLVSIAVTQPGEESIAWSLARLGVAVGAITASCWIAGRGAHLFRQPPVIGQIFAGIALGPSLLGHLWPGATDVVHPPSVAEPVSWLSQLGIMLFLILAGMEIDTGLVRRSGKLLVTVSQTGFVVPLALGAAFAVAAFPHHAPQGAQQLPFTLLIAAAMSVTALPVLVLIVNSGRLKDSALAAIAITSAAVADIQAWIIIVIVTGIVAGSTGNAAVGIAITIGMVIALLSARTLLSAILVDQKIPENVRVAAYIGGGLGFAALLSLTGMHAAIGAFIFGLAAPRVGRIIEESRRFLSPVLNGMLIPLFFASSGLVVDLTKITSGELWGWLAGALGVAILGKWVAVSLAARIVGASWSDSAQLGALLNCRGTTEIVVLGIGLQLGLLGTELFTVLVVVAVLCTVMTWPALRSIDRLGSLAPRPRIARENSAN